MDNTRKLARFFSALSDETRIKIIDLLSSREMTVNEIREVIGTSLPAISYQLRILLTSDLVKYEKRGRKKFFRLADDHVKHILQESQVHLGSFNENNSELHFHESKLVN